MTATAEDRRTNPTWQSFLDQYRIRDIRDCDGGGWDVESASGSTYHVDASSQIDGGGSMYFQWHCDCPARKRCRHIDAVEQMRHAEACADEDYDGLEVLERFAD